MLQPSPVPTPPFLDRFRNGAGRRGLAIALVILVELLLLLALLTLGAEKQPGREETTIKMVDLEAAQVPEEMLEPSSPEPASQPDERPVPQQPPAEEQPAPRPAEPPRPQPIEPQPLPPAPPVLPPPEVRPPSSDAPRNTTPSPPAPRRVYGPPDRGGSPALRDTERVGTAPNGEPLYAAAWYREPRPEQLRAYLSTATGPGWGLIACRTAPDYRVEDCVALDEYPEGSQITRAVLAAAWEFRVRPPRLGGKLLVGSWVRIRIDYTIKRR